MSNNNEKVIVVGGGLAGCEAAWQIAQQGVEVTLIEKRPLVKTPAHKTGDFAELVCSNSFKSLELNSASGLLKNEMSQLQSLIIKEGHNNAVPAGKALGIDRSKFSAAVTDCLKKHPLITIKYEEVEDIPDEEYLIKNNLSMIIATGPLTDGSMMSGLSKLCGSKENLYFYDAIAPIFFTESIDLDKVFFADRYQQESPSHKPSYMNIPLTKEEYYEFVDNIKEAEKVPLKPFEKEKYFESCLPVEVMVDRGVDTLRFGPMKPVGLVDPKSKITPYACIQLRAENKEGSMYSMVGFQTKMKWPEQKRVFSSIEALNSVEFLRYGSIHRNSYVLSSEVLNKDFSFKANPRVYLAGQLTGVEGYTESASSGLLVGRIVAAKCKKMNFQLPPENTVIGALAAYVLNGGTGAFSPMNANHGLLPSLKEKKLSRRDRRNAQCRDVQKAFDHYLNQNVSVTKQM